jgi:NAD(P)-dependent dehydrogenase (short-subunit alcohol dehydrogenase family)
MLSNLSRSTRGIVTASSSALTSNPPTFVPCATQCRRFSSYDDDGYNSSEETKTALVLGSSGAVGRTVTQHLSKNLGMHVIGADIVDLPHDQDNSLDTFISIPTWDQHSGVGDMTEALVRSLCDVMEDGKEFDAIICASGGWQGDPPLPKADASDEDFISGARAYGETIDRMMGMNLSPVLAAGYAANRFMAEEGKRKYRFDSWMVASSVVAQFYYSMKVCLSLLVQQ